MNCAQLWLADALIKIFILEPAPLAVSERNFYFPYLIQFSSSKNFNEPDKFLEPLIQNLFSSNFFVRVIHNCSQKNIVNKKNCKIINLGRIISVVSSLRTEIVENRSVKNNFSVSECTGTKIRWQKEESQLNGRLLRRVADAEGDKFPSFSPPPSRFIGMGVVSC